VRLQRRASNGRALTQHQNFTLKEGKKMAKAQQQKQASTPIGTVPPTDGATEVRFHVREALERLHDEVLAPLKMLSLLLSTCAEGLAIESSDLRGLDNC
jgi:hypothetical protein